MAVQEQEQGVIPSMCPVILRHNMEVFRSTGHILLIKLPDATIVEKLSSVFAMGVSKGVHHSPAHWMMCRLLWVHVFDEVSVCVLRNLARP